MLDMQALAQEVVNLAHGSPPGKGGLKSVVPPRHSRRSGTANQPVVARRVNLENVVVRWLGINYRT